MWLHSAKNIICSFILCFLVIQSETSEKKILYRDNKCNMCMFTRTVICMSRAAVVAKKEHSDTWASWPRLLLLTSPGILLLVSDVNWLRSQQRTTKETDSIVCEALNLTLACLSVSLLQHRTCTNYPNNSDFSTFCSKRKRYDVAKIFVW